MRISIKIPPAIKEFSLAVAALSLQATGSIAAESKTYSWSSSTTEARPDDDGVDWNLRIRRPDRLTAAISAETTGGDNKDLAKQLANPISSLISLPFQNDFHFGGGPDGDGFKWKMNIQPVVPITLNDDWNLIWRTILPVVSQTDVAGTPGNPSGTQTGIGDTLVSLFFSPKEPTQNGWVWGVGPVVSLKTASNSLLGSGKWGVGPTAIALKQDGGFTYGALVNHVWSYAGDSNRSDVSNTFLQPFLSYTTDKATTLGLNTESGYNWETENWTVPINLMLSQLVDIGNQPVQFQIGATYFAEGPQNSPEWGLRAAATFLFPK